MINCPSIVIFHVIAMISLVMFAGSIPARLQTGKIQHIANNPSFVKSTLHSHHAKTNRLSSCIVKSSVSLNNEAEEVDPITGEVIGGTSQASTASFTYTPPGSTLSWAYRTEDINQTEAEVDQKLPVVCLHALGSSSYVYRNLINLLSNAGHKTLALDWPGHGASSKPLPSKGTFDFSVESYIKALDEVLTSGGLGVSGPVAMIVHGYILSQVAMLWAARNPDLVSKLIIINTPLSLKSKLRPELAAYKAPLSFLRPKPDARFDGAMYNAAGSPYAMAYKDACAYDAPYQEDPAASSAIYHTMEALDFNALLKEVDEAYTTWRNPALVIHGGADTFLDLKGPLEWLESKRTCMKMASGIEAKIGHSPLEDYSDAVAPTIIKFLQDN